MFNETNLLLLVPYIVY